MKIVLSLTWLVFAALATWFCVYAFTYEHSRAITYDQIKILVLTLLISAVSLGCAIGLGALARPLERGSASRFWFFLGAVLSALASFALLFGLAVLGALAAMAPQFK